MTTMRQQELSRGAGILLPVSSLPSPYGIGTFGKSAYDFVDDLVAAGQSYWQVLPIGPTSFGDSPYQAFSAFAGNPYFIDLDILADQGLLSRDELSSIDWGSSDSDIDYAKLYNERFRILKKAYLAFLGSPDQTIKEQRTDFDQFKKRESGWLSDYSLFMALKDKNDGKSWQEWDKDIKTRQPEALDYYRGLLAEQSDYYSFIQFEFYRQWTELKRYANGHGISIIGDIPIYVALDSADVWCNPLDFQLDGDLKPVEVAGCPPDAFSDYGQKWGNPLYNWKKMKQDGFTWWKKRMGAAAGLYDIVRIDHFLGVVKYYCIPVDGDPVDGHYEEGPGKDLTDAIDQVMNGSKVIAEDLGVQIDGVKKLLSQTGYPGMKILEFAFDGNRNNEYLPHMYDRNCVVYSGTHDNETLVGYFKSLSPMGYQYLLDYTGSSDQKELITNILRMAYMSVADTVVIQMQDILEKDNSARMNLPSTIGTNWRWRMKAGEFTQDKIRKLRKLSDTYARNENRKVNKEQMVEETAKKLFGRGISQCTNEELYITLLHIVKDMAEQRKSDAGKKKVYYISAEFLIGKLLSNNMLNLGIFDQVKKELQDNGKSIYDIEEVENEPSLGNGGLGRLAACFLDSMASIGIHGDGVGINYHLGLFKQEFAGNLQKETPNPWITKDSWLIDRKKYFDVEFRYHTVHAHMYDIPVTGYENRTNELHLFDIDSVDEHITEGDSISFNKDDIEKNLTLFLYPDDSDDKGRMLRIYQEYFMVSAGAQLIIEECLGRGSNLHDLYD
ncbi:MAG: 4-alpha-glucanotransferase, partial [Lachnospiraceae bacterium]|nr:4-alpha-glucanotransferase [Lachnospiraceae bacterium]